MSATYQKAGETLWRGHQWAVTTYGLETWCEPYHYYLDKDQISGLREGEHVLDSMLHMMEKSWLDVNDFFTAYLAALAIHGAAISGSVVQASITAALKERAYMFTPQPGQIPLPPMTPISIADMDKYLPEPAWHGSTVIGAALGGIADAEDDVLEVEDGED